jgi:hypothetical protein
MVFTFTNLSYKGFRLGWGEAGGGEGKGKEGGLRIPHVHCSAQSTFCPLSLLMPPGEGSWLGSEGYRGPEQVFQLTHNRAGSAQTVSALDPFPPSSTVA